MFILYCILARERERERDRTQQFPKCSPDNKRRWPSQPSNMKYSCYLNVIYIIFKTILLFIIRVVRCVACVRRIQHSGAFVACTWNRSDFRPELERHRKFPTHIFRYIKLCGFHYRLFCLSSTFQHIHRSLCVCWWASTILFWEAVIFQTPLPVCHPKCMLI